MLSFTNLLEFTHLNYSSKYIYKCIVVAHLLRMFMLSPYFQLLPMDHTMRFIYIFNLPKDLQNLELALPLVKYFNSYLTRFFHIIYDQSWKLPVSENI